VGLVGRWERTVSTSNNDCEIWRARGELSSRSAGASSHVVDLDVSRLVPCDLSVVDVLARLQVLVLRCGGRLLLHGVDGGLAELLGFVGLDDVIHLCWCCRGATHSPPV
jgi:ABC-type transporter Mla MlaB component